MGLRFRRSFRLMPGVRMNVSKSGVSSSFGSRGAWFTLGPRGTRTTIGIPGSGLSYTTMQGSRHRPRLELEHEQEGAADPARANADFARGLIAIAVVMLAIGWIVHAFSA